jgi:hypothetical protein
MKKFSRALIVPVALLASNASAVCPLFDNKASHVLCGSSKFIVGDIVANSSLALGKNEHAKRALCATVIGQTIEALQHGGSKPHPIAFAERVAVDWGVRKASDMIGLEGMRNAAVKKIDVLPQGMIRDLVNPIVEGAAELVTNPEVLTCVVVNVVLPMVMDNKGKQ